MHKSVRPAFGIPFSRAHRAWEERVLQPGASPRPWRQGGPHASRSPCLLRTGCAQENRRDKLPELELSLCGRFSEHHGAIIRMALAQIDLYDQQLAELDRRIAELLERCPQITRAAEQLRSIPGVELRSAQAIIAEIGVDMDQFGSDKRLASWAGVCPGKVPATTRVLASVAAVGPERVTAGCGAPSTSARGQHVRPIPSSVAPFAPCSRASAAKRQPSRSRTRSWSSATTYSAPGRSMTTGYISAPIPTWRPDGRPMLFGPWNVSATS